MKRLRPLRFSPVIFGTLVFCLSFPALARDRIQIVGSPVVLDFAETIGKEFAKNWGFPTPLMELNGTGVGFGLFCKGVGFETPDLNGASRKMTAAEFATCQKNGVTSITEIEFGLDGLVLVSSKKNPMVNLSRAELFTALARQIESDNAITTNSTKNWNDINPRLPALPIKLMAPPADSPAMYGFVENVMAKGCESFAQFAALKEEDRHQKCRSLRKDDVFVEGLKNEARKIEWLTENPSAFAVMNFLTFQRHQDSLMVHRIEGVLPTVESITAKKYPLTTPLLLYVKNQHIASIPGMEKLLYEFASERAISPDGYLTDKGLVPVDEIGRNRARDNAISLRTIKIEEKD